MWRELGRAVRTVWAVMILGRGVVADLRVSYVDFGATVIFSHDVAANWTWYQAYAPSMN